MFINRLMTVYNQGNTGALPYYRVKTAIMNIQVRVLLLDGLENSCKALFHWANLFARSVVFVGIALADVMSNADKG